MGAVEAVVETAEVVDEVVEAVEHISNLNGTTRKQQIIVLVVVGVGAAVASGAVSHFVTKKVMRAKFETMMEEELEKTRRFYHEREQRAAVELPQPEDPEVMLAKVQTDQEVLDEVESEVNEFLTAEDGTMMMKRLQEASAKGKSEVAVEKAKVVSVFDEDLEEVWVEKNRRKEALDQPFVISKEQYLENEYEFFQITYTYFDGDDVLVDEGEDIVTDPDKFVGVENLSRFGWMSEDKNTVYIRNVDCKVEIEVMRSEGSYANEVLGFQHGDENFQRTRKGGRMRFGDD